MEEPRNRQAEADFNQIIQDSELHFTRDEKKMLFQAFMKYFTKKELKLV